jgi:hypothetical protein
VNGRKRDFDMAKVCKFGRTEVNMKATGKTIWLMERGV